MEANENFSGTITDSFKQQNLIIKILLIIILISFLCCICTVPIYLISEINGDGNNESSSINEAVDDLFEEGSSILGIASATPTQTSTMTPSSTPTLTATLSPTETPIPTETPLPPTATPDLNIVYEGTYLVGIDILPGLYRGYAGNDLFSSCYWERLSDTSGELSSIIANDNSNGQFYIQIAETDFAFTTACSLTRLEGLPAPPADYPTTISPGTYLINSDILPGLYQGQAGTDFMDSCYWERLSNVGGSFNGINANDNATGQFYVQVYASDLALHTNCELTRIGD